MPVSLRSRLKPLAIVFPSVILTFAGNAPLHAQGVALEEIVVTAQRRLETTQETPISITAISAAGIESRGIQGFGDLIGDVPGVGGFEAPGSRGSMGLSIRGVSGGSPANVSLDPAIAMYMDGVYVGKTVGSSLDVADLERIEVLRGPQGTLYGRNSTGGAVNFITRRPLGEFSTRVTGTVGNYDLWGVRATLDLPSVGTVGEGAGQLAATVGYQIRKRGSLYDNDAPGQKDFDTIDREAWRLALSWRPVDTVDVDYTFDRSELDERGSMQQVVGFVQTDLAGTNRVDFLRNQLTQGAMFAQMMNPGDSRIPDRLIPSLDRTIAAYERAEARGEGRRSRGWADNTPTTETDVTGHSLTVEWDAGELGALGFVSFKSITGYREMDSFVFGALDDIDSRLDANGVGAMNDLVLSTLVGLYTNPAAVFPTAPPAFLPFLQQNGIENLWAAIDDIGAFHSLQDTDTEYQQFSQEFQMIGATDRLDYALGLYYFEDDSKYRRRAIFAAPLSGAPVQNYDLETEAWAVYGQGTWRPPVLEDRLSITAGLRYTREKKSIEYNYLTTFSPLSPDFTGGPLVEDPAAPLNTSRTNTFTNLSGTFTLAYEFTDDFNAFLRYATGYRSGGFNGELFDNAFDEEEIEQWEVGIKTDWWNRRLRINGSLYTYVYDDLQVSQISVGLDGQTSTSIVNAGKADRWGGEVEVLVAPVADLVLGLSYSYINGDFDRFPPLVNAQGVATPMNNVAKRGASPSNQLNLTADYTFARLEFGDITGFLQVNWQDAWIESSLWTATFDGQPIALPHQKMDERTIVNARINLENVRVGDGTLKFSLWGRNLTNDDHPTFAINFGNLGPFSEQYGEPRTYGLDVTYQY